MASSSDPREPKKRWRVQCLLCAWVGYRRQRSATDARLDACPQCASQSLSARPVHSLRRGRISR